MASQNCLYKLVFILIDLIMPGVGQMLLTENAYYIKYQDLLRSFLFQIFKFLGVFSSYYLLNLLIGL